MRTKVLGRTGLKVSIVGLGAATLGISDVAAMNSQYSPSSRGISCMNENQGVEVIIAAVKAGVTLIDTAPLYGSGASERIIGRFFHEWPEFKNKVAVTTKVGNLYNGAGFDFSYDAVMRSVEGSQKRLGRENFSVLYLHDPMGQDMKFVMSKRGAFGALLKLKCQKVAQYIGVAANDPETNADYIETGEFDAATIPLSWSLVNQTAQKRILPAAIKYNVGLVCPSAVERGFLADDGSSSQYFGREFSVECREHVAKIRVLCSKFGIPLLAVALQWCARHPQVAAAIPGAAFPSEARENTEAGKVNIPEEFWEEIKPLIKQWKFVADGIQIA